MNPKIQIKRILFATDFLESSRLALDYAVAFAGHFKATIVMLHVVELSQGALEAEAETSRPSLMRKALQERLEVLAQGVRRLGLQVEAHVDDGIPSEVVLDAIGKYSADLLVLGIHGVHRGIEHLLVGSNTEKILLNANCPVLTVGAHVLSGVDLYLHIKEIVYFSDFTPEAVTAAPYALYLGKEFDARVDVCQLLPVVAEGNEDLRKKLAENYCKSMEQILQHSDSAWCSPAFQLERGMEVEQIVERARDNHAGLIVLGVRTASHLGRHLHTSFAYHVLAEATCPVLSVRHRDVA